jgi:eukaryotic-like serine/threonine-protein kinase
MEGPDRRVIRFGTFEADSVTGELRKGGFRVNLQDQPFRLLLLLLERPGEVVARTELREKLWGETYVDFEEGLNTAVRKLRDALGDSATSPRFIETLPRRGYRFIASVQGVDPYPSPPERKSSRRSSVWWFRFAVCAGILIGGAFFVRAWLVREQPGFALSPPAQLTRDSGLTTDPAISPDGKLLAYASDRDGAGNLDIWVQHVSGGAARRLTTDPADDREPDISPEGNEVIFRSERNGGGIYSVPILGGEPRLVIKGGFLPRFSPDGSRIAYSLGTFGSGGFEGNLYVYTIATGSTHILAPDLTVAGSAAWTSDGKSLVFAGFEVLSSRPIYLFTCSADGGAVTQMSARPIVEGPALFGQLRALSVAWFRGQVIISEKHGDSSNLWVSNVAPGTRRLAGELKRMTLGSGNEALPTVSAGGKLVFASDSYSSAIWEATLDQASTAPAIRRLTHDHAVNYRPSVSTDGSKLAYLSDRTGRFEVWVRDFSSGIEAALTGAAKEKTFAAISRDGSQVAFTDDIGVYVTSSIGGAARLLCERCGRPDDWSPDGKLILGPGSMPLGIRLWDLTTGLVTRIAAHKILHTTAPHLSPDGNWLTFHTAEDVTSPEKRIRGKRQVFIAPYTGQWAPASSWIAITDGQALDREGKWSADGNRIYFLSDRDGFRCIWARNLDPKTKQPLGSIYPVLHLHSASLSLFHIPNTGRVNICSVGGKLIFAMGELTGNLWMTELRQQ